MPHHCIVPQCTNNSSMPYLSFYRLPLNDPNLLEKWLVNIRRANIRLNEHSQVCSEHFKEGKKDKNHVPTIFSWSKSASSRPSPKPRADPPPFRKSHSFGVTADIHPENHINTCSRDLIQDTTHDKEVLVKPDVIVTAVASTNTVLIDTAEASTQTENLVVEFSDACTMTDKNSTESSAFRVEQIQEDQKAIQFYTGFSSMKLLLACFTFLDSVISKLSYGDHHKQCKGKPHKISPLNEFFMMLCRLRLGLYEQDLAYRFQISQPTVSRICSTWINFSFCKFKEIPIWPSRTIVDCNMPLVFQDLYPSTRCIIDTTEIFIQKPQNPSAQQLMFSNYKNHNTFKALIGISPSGAVVFVSDLLGGNISDKQLTAQSGLLDCLEEGDSVMADRGFNIADLLESKNVTLIIPRRLSDSQLSESDRVVTCRIASVRVHVERAIGRIKLFRILESIPNSMHNMANQIFFVCSLLTNFQPTLVE